MRLFTLTHPSLEKRFPRFFIPCASKNGHMRVPQNPPASWLSRGAKQLFWPLRWGLRYLIQGITDDSRALLTPSTYQHLPPQPSPLHLSFLQLLMFLLFRLTHYFCQVGLKYSWKLNSGIFSVLPGLVLLLSPATSTAIPPLSSFGCSADKTKWLFWVRQLRALNHLLRRWGGGEDPGICRANRSAHSIRSIIFLPHSHRHKQLSLDSRPPHPQWNLGWNFPALPRPFLWFPCNFESSNTTEFWFGEISSEYAAEMNPNALPGAALASWSQAAALISTCHTRLWRLLMNIQQRKCVFLKNIN